MKWPVYNLERFLREQAPALPLDSARRPLPFALTTGADSVNFRLRADAPNHGTELLLLDPGGHTADPHDPTRELLRQCTIEARSRDAVHVRTALEGVHDTLVAKETSFVLPPPLDGLGLPRRIAGPAGEQEIAPLRVLAFEGVTQPLVLGRDEDGWFRANLMFVVRYQEL